MRFLLAFVLLLSLFACTNQPQEASIAKAEVPTEKEPAMEQQEYAIVIHGGAGTVLKKNTSPEREKALFEALNGALDAAEAVLKNGGSAMDAVEAAIVPLEDAPEFNAGKGAVFTSKEANELDASVMDGKTRAAGAVAGIKTVKNPIQAARAVLEKSNHVMLSGAGADTFAKEMGLEIVDNSYFATEDRMNWLKGAREAENKSGAVDLKNNGSKFGTVGAAALDKNGNLAAGTSTGGMTNKKYGRIGDSPIIGAGTFADNNSCAVSCTGHGEYFIRYVVAYEVAALMQYQGKSLEEAADHVINKTLKDVDGAGGLIAIDKYGNVAMPFNTTSMYRAYLKANGERVVELYGPEE